jgi:hypothetical protein
VLPGYVETRTVVLLIALHRINLTGLVAGLTTWDSVDAKVGEL